MASTSVAAVLFLISCHAEALPAFPGAEGFGAEAAGGRGGDVYYVTNLDDYRKDDAPIAGSLRHAINTATNARTILFKVSGNIRLKSDLRIDKPRLALAGQSAPGDGICLQDYPLILQANDLVVQHLRTRLGTNALQQADAMSITGGTNIMVDHCSASWSVDETLSSGDTAQNVTVQWTYITESLNESIHKKGPHGYGSLIRPRIDADYTFHHNLYAHHYSRNPRAGTYNQKLLRLDFRNNLIYNWGIKAGYNYYPEEHLHLNYINNYLISGPSTTCFSCAFDTVALDTVIYQSGNRFDVNRNGRVDGIDSGWRMFIGDHKKSVTPHPAPAVSTDPAEIAYERVLTQAGAMPWRRDPVDVRVTDTVRQQTGQIINYTTQVGGWPALNTTAPPLDTDKDGMPDQWESALGLNANEPSDRNRTNTSGYTQLEEYLQWLSAPHISGFRNIAIEVDLRGLIGNVGVEFRLSVADATNGTISLKADSHTAVFMPARDFTGRARFLFNALDPATKFGFGLVTVGVLVAAQREPGDP